MLASKVKFKIRWCCSSCRPANKDEKTYGLAFLHTNRMPSFDANQPAPTKQQHRPQPCTDDAARCTLMAPLVAVLAANAAETPQTPTVSREVLSGLAGGAAQRITKDVVLYPIDTVKVRLQTVQGRHQAGASSWTPTLVF